MKDITASKIIERIKTSTFPCKIAITGGRHVGKTTALLKIYKQAAANRLDIAGFVELAVFNGSDRTGYRFMDICTNETSDVAQRLDPNGYKFYDEAWQWAEQKLLASENHAILIIDELGRLEAQNQGLMPALRASMARHPRHLIAAVRDDALDAIASSIDGFDAICRIDPIQ